MLHLIEDMSLPEHTHLECHANTTKLPCNGTRSYEAYVTTQIPNEGSECETNKPDSLLCKIKNILDSREDLSHIPSTKMPGRTDYTGDAANNNGIVKFDNIRDYFENLARISYFLNRHKADLKYRNRRLTGEQLGPLGQMFNGPSPSDRLRYNPDGCSTLAPFYKWYIPGLDNTDTFWNEGCLDTSLTNGSWWETRSGEPSNRRERSGFYYIEDTQSAIPDVYKTFWDPGHPDGVHDRYEINTERLPLAELYARDLIPLAIRYVAGAIELFWNETHPESQTFTASGRVTTNNGGGISGVTMKFTRDLFETEPVLPSVQTNGNGYWNQSGFRSDEAYVVTPSKPGYDFTPFRHLFGSENSTGLDFIGTPSPDLPPSVTYFQINNGASSTTSRTVTLNNTATESPTHYMASESSTFSGASWQTYSTGPNFTLSSGNVSKTVYFKVKNSAGESGVVNDSITLDEVCTTLSTPNPTCVSTVSTTTPTLSWSNVANESGYEVKIFSGGSCSGTQIYTDTVAADSTGSGVPSSAGLQSGQTYSWQVQAKGNGTTYCDSNWSSCCSFTVGTCTSTLATPSPSCVGTVYTTTPNLRWYSVANASGYVVKIFGGSGCSGTPIHTSSQLPANITTTGYDVPSSVGLQNGQTYFWQVQAKGNGTTYCDGPWSTCCSFTVSVCTTLSTPSPSAPSCGSTINTTTPVLAWNNVANESGYAIRIFSGNSCSGTPIHTSTFAADTTGYGVPSSAGLQSGQTYSWQVQAKGNGTTYCDGNWSSCCSFTVSPIANIIVTSPNGGESWQAGTTQTIRWNYTGDPGSYVKIELLKGGVFNTTIASGRIIGSGGSGDYNWSIPATQTPGSDYKVRVTSSTNSSYTDTSDNNFTISAPPGCSEVEPNDFYLDAGPLTLNVGCIGKISTSTDWDWFVSRSVNSGTTISFTLTVPVGVDLVMELYGPISSDPLIRWRKTADNGGTGQNESLTYATTATGNFYVLIHGYQGSYSATATYTITRTQ